MSITTIYSTGLNEAVEKQIKELELLVEKIGPDNIRYLPDTLIRKIDAVFKNRITYDDGAMINSYSAKIIKRCLDYLESSKVESIIRTQKFEINDSKVSRQFLIDDIPEGFSGLNSFTFLTFKHSGSAITFASTNLLNSIMSTRTRDLDSGLGSDKLSFSWTVIPRDSSILISLTGFDGSVNEDGTASSYIDLVTKLEYIETRTLFWRYK